MSELVGAVLTRPSIDIDEAGSILRREWGFDGTLRPLPSERDRNFAIAIDGVDRYVLKVANGIEDRGFLELQHAAMRLLSVAGVPCQVAVPMMTGAEIVDVGSIDRPSLVRLLTFLPGRPLFTIPPADRPNELLVDIGRVMGRTAAALAGFDHPAAHRSFHWSPERGLKVIAAHAGAVTRPDRRRLLDRWQSRLASLASVLPGLRHAVIHNDGHDHNVLVAEDRRTVSGLLDLGDSVWTVVVNELAIPAAYAALDAVSPLDVIDAVRSGFEEVLPLDDRERAILPELVALRMATSVALSAHQSRLDPDDPYLTASERPAWALLERLIAIPAGGAAAR